MESDPTSSTLTSSLVEIFNTNELLEPHVKMGKVENCLLVHVKKEPKDLPCAASVEMVTNTSMIKVEPKGDLDKTKQYNEENFMNERGVKQEPALVLHWEGKRIKKDIRCNLDSSPPETNSNESEYSSCKGRKIPAKTETTEIVEEIEETPDTALHEWNIKKEEVDVKEEDIEETTRQNQVIMLPNDVGHEEDKSPDVIFRYQNRNQEIHSSNLRMRPNQETMGEDILKNPLPHVLKPDQCDVQPKLGLVLRSHRRRRKNPDEVIMFKCVECTFQSHSKYRLKEHSIKHKSLEERVAFKCSQCEYKTYRKCNMRRHLRKHKDPAEINFFKCQLCHYRTPEKYILTKHFLVHQNPEDVDMFKCQQCDFQSKRKNSVKKHILLHNNSEENMFKCDKCKYQCKSKYGLKEHMLVHMSKKERVMFKCHQCDYQTFRKSDLKKHIINTKICVL